MVLFTFLNKHSTYEESMPEIFPYKLLKDLIQNFPINPRFRSDNLGKRVENCLTKVGNLATFTMTKRVRRMNKRRAGASRRRKLNSFKFFSPLRFLFLFFVRKRKRFRVREMIERPQERSENSLFQFNKMINVF